MHQRYIPLALTRRAGGVDLTAPANANAAPPGYYMLFLVNEAGVPSVAKFVRIAPEHDTAASPPRRLRLRRRREECVVGGVECGCCGGG